MPSILHKNPLFCYYREPENFFTASRSCRGGTSGICEIKRLPLKRKPMAAEKGESIVQVMYRYARIKHFC